MPTPKKRPQYFTSEDGVFALQELQALDEDMLYHTGSSYSANGELYPDHEIPFVDKHMAYLRDHPELDSRQYIANIKLKTKIKH
jgi:hypothetical protein